jgi:hypothetical protein
LLAGMPSPGRIKSPAIDTASVFRQEATVAGSNLVQVRGISCTGSAQASMATRMHFAWAEVHNVKIFHGRISVGCDLLDPVSGLASAAAQWPIEEGYVRVCKIHHRNAERPSVNFDDSVRDSMTH